MTPRSSGLNLAMKLIDISSHRQKDALCQCICLSTIQISSKIHVLFYVSKRTFCLNTAIHTEHRSLLTCDPFQIFCTFLTHRLRDHQHFITFFHRCFAVVSLDTFRFIRTAGTVWTSVISFYTDRSAGCFTSAFICNSQFPSIPTDIAVSVCVILHVFSSADVFFVFSGFRNLIVLRLYIGGLSVSLNEKIVFFTFVSGSVLE